MIVTIGVARPNVLADPNGSSRQNSQTVRRSSRV